MGPIHLGVNVDHVATLRQARHTRYPDPVTAALIAEHSGADSITVHLREDRRHIQARDVEVLLRTVQTRVNLEMAVTESMVDFAVKHRPADCCLVPERREELTTEGGLDVAGQRQRVAAVVPHARAARYPRIAVHRPGDRAGRSERRGGRSGRRAAYRRVRAKPPVPPRRMSSRASNRPRAARKRSGSRCMPVTA